MEIQAQILALNEEERAAIASAILQSLDPPRYTVSDEEVLERKRQLESGEITEIGHEELLASIDPRPTP